VGPLPLWQAAALGAVGSLALLPRLLGWTYVFQLDEYLPPRLLASLRRRIAARRWQTAALPLAAVLLLLLAARLPSDLRPLPLLASALLPLGLRPGFAARSRLTWTQRARRLFAAAAGASLVLLVLGFWSGPEGALLPGLADPLTVLALSLAALGWSPYERGRRRAFMRQAERRLGETKPLVVGITGSYGKTTTKVLLAQLLDVPEGSCFATPASYNTTLGVCRAINEGLRPQHQVAVLEMGAYRPGEIAEICSFSHPRVGVVTAVGPMHLERFGTVERVAQAKSELLAALPPDGFAVVPSEIRERARLLAPLSARLVEVGRPGDRWWLEGAEVVGEATSCRLRGREGEELELEVRLFGRHLLQDLLCALAVAAELGRPLPELAERARGLRGAPHRLEVTRRGGVTIIDDAYNSNPEGAREALQLLGQLPGRRRVLVTPGYIELGEEEEESMTELGRQAAAVCTHVILVGPRHTEPVHRGLAGAGFPAAQVSVVADLEEAQAVLPKVAGEGSVVLFENDLPDQYRERP
jgi:UDP-N-acetylmuramoyl-tripeptide--D-alanyl-D-alanine ligase